VSTLGEPTNIVLDTHAIKEIFGNKETREKTIYVTHKVCHFLITPNLESEFRVHISSSLLMFLSSLYTKLRGKFIHKDRPSRSLPRNLERHLRESNADKGDFIVARVAYKRSRERKTLIISDDECFHNAFPTFRKYHIEILTIDEFVREIDECYLALSKR